jgi:hypothetical protein
LRPARAAWWGHLGHPLVAAGALLYAGLRLNRHWLHHPVPSLLSAYLGDLLCMPLLLSLLLAAHRLLINRRGTLPVAWLVGAWAYVAVWFEGLLPLWSPQAVADPLDVVAYALGTWAFHHWLNRLPRSAAS